jgi:dUTP pyrophosphatase
MALLSMPDDQFDMMAPGVLEAYSRSVNNPNDRIMLVQALNATGYSADDLTDSIVEITETIDKLELPVAKKDFLKQLIGTLTNAVNETEGISKRYISVPIELCNEKAVIPQYAHVSDSGVDVYALEDITVHPGETVLVPTGIKVALPPGYELQVRPKSGRALKTKLRVANTPGTIDSGYRDEIKVIIENVEPPIKDLTIDDEGRVTSVLYGSDFFIGKGEKFCQLVLSEVPKIAFYRVENIAEVDDIDRGGGFGSTGLK